MYLELSWTRLPKIESQKTYLVGSKFNIPCPNIQLTPVDNTRQLKENWEPAFDPDLVGLWNSTILATVLLEHLQQKYACVTYHTSVVKIFQSKLYFVRIEGDFQPVLRSLSTSMFCESMLIVTNCLSLRHSNFFFQQLLWFWQLRSCFIK